MKNSQKNKSGVKKHLTSKGKKTQMRNKRAARKGYYVPSRQPKKKMEKAQKLFIALVALVCAFSISFITLGTILLVDIFSTPEHGSIYERIDLSDYITVEDGLYKGQNVDLSRYYRAPYTLADMDDYLEGLRYENRKLIAKTQKLTPIGYGDDFGYYIVSVLKDGKAILEKDFAGNDYQNFSTSMVGREDYGADFDAKLVAMAVRPNDTALHVRYNGKISLTDVIALTYQAKNSTATSASTMLEGGRIDLAALHAKGGKDAEMAESLVANCKEIGEPFEFTLENYDLDGNGKIADKEKKVTFVAMVDFAVVEEKTVDVTFTLPEDYFSAADAQNGNIPEAELETYLALNGKEVTFRLIIIGSDDYELPALDASFIKETLKFETDKTADADVIAAFKEHSLAEQNAALEKSLFNTYVKAMLSRFGETAYQKQYPVGENNQQPPMLYPEGTYEEAFYEAYDAMIANYVATYGAEPTSQNAIDAFTQSYVYGTQGVQVAGLSDYCQKQAQSQVYQELLMYYIFRTEKLEITDEMMESAYREYVDGLIESYGDPATYNEAKIIEIYGGKDALYEAARREILVYRVVGEYLLQNNNITYTK